jgi:hypothetical protein
MGVARLPGFAQEVSMAAVSDLGQQLAALEPRLNPGVYVFVTIAEGRNIDASAIVATVREPEGTSMVIEAGAAAAAGLPPSALFAWITLSVQSDLQSVGLTAEFSRVLSAAHIGCNVIAGARHDHIFVPAGQVDRAMSELHALQSGARTQAHRRLASAQGCCARHAGAHHRGVQAARLPAPQPGDGFERRLCAGARTLCEPGIFVL